MDQAAGVRGVERVTDLPDDARDALEDASVGRPAQDLAQVRPVDQAHRHEQDAVGLARCVHGQDVRVLDRRGGRRLAQEPPAERPHRRRTPGVISFSATLRSGER